MKRALMILAAAAVIGGTYGAEAQAQAKPKAAPAAKAKVAKAGTITGIDKIHSQVNVGNKVCMADHEHVGEGEMPSRKGAEGAAIRKWQVFTADEYGSAWGKYSLAVAKKMTCKDTGGRHTCTVLARPCRPSKV